MAEFFALLDRLVASSALRIDRRRGEAHPRFPDVVYPLAYGYLEGTSATDNAELDVFVGSAAGVGVVGVLLTVDLGKRDAELKVLLDCTLTETETAQRFCADVLRVGSHLVARAHKHLAESRERGRHDG